MVAGEYKTLDGANERIKQLERTLQTLVDHYAATAGPRAHKVGCDCSGSPDGKHSCYTFGRAYLVAAACLTG